MAVSNLEGQQMPMGSQTANVNPIEESDNHFIVAIINRFNLQGFKFDEEIVKQITDYLTRRQEASNANFPINSKYKGDTMLTASARAGCWRAAKCLISLGANYNIPGRSGDTPYYIACNPPKRFPGHDFMQNYFDSLGANYECRGPDFSHCTDIRALNSGYQTRNCMNWPRPTNPMFESSPMWDFQPPPNCQ